MSASSLPLLRRKLCQLGDSLRDALLEQTRGKSAAELSRVAGESQADTIYAIDRIGEETILRWFATEWPADEPVELVMEGIEDDEAPCFPAGTSVEDTKWKCILDPIDGTRGIMYDKRSAWALAGLAPQKGIGTSLSDLVISVMTELPTSRAWRSDQISAIRGGGILAEAVDVRDGSRTALELHPSRATDFRHGFASFVKFFPEGRTLTAQIEEQIWDRLIGLGSSPSPVVFDDQYISTGGQFYELLSGHDRLIADIRPIVLQRLAYEHLLACHPYDMAGIVILREAGILIEDPWGEFPDALLDTTSPVAWIAYANPALADLARPVIQQVMNEMLS